jgi:hypothetical protein
MQSCNIMKSHFFTNNTLASSRLKLRLRAECAEPHDQRHISQLAASFLPPCEKLNPDLHTRTQNTAPASETDAFHRDLQRQEHHPANTEGRSSVEEEHTAQDKKKSQHLATPGAGVDELVCGTAPRRRGRRRRSRRRGRIRRRRR